MLDFLRLNRLRISVILIAIVLISILVSQTDQQRSTNWFVRSVHYISYPFQISAHYINQRVSGFWHHYIWLVDVREQNEQLRRKVKELEEINASNAEIRIAYRRLLQLLEFEKKDPNRKVYASVVMEIHKPFSHLLVIDKGADNGIRPNFGVVTPEGIVGKVQSVTDIQSMVQLVTDSQSQFPVLIQRTRTKAMLRVEDGRLVINEIPRRLELFDQDRVVTSGLAGIFPKGFPVGRIQEIYKEEFGLFQRVTVSPAGDLDKIEEVAVILNSVYSIHQPLFTDID